jgi:curved DNA-binding protein CbpA
VPDDLYAALGVERTASQAEIRAAYRRLAQTHHPDHPSGSDSAMMALNLAYRVLGDPERRRRYDASLAPRIWADEDLDTHADDLRQMFEEERNLWEQLLAVHPEASVEAALAQTRQAQLDLENAIRAHFNIGPPLSTEQFEVQRASELASTPRPPSGCLMLLFGLAHLHAGNHA